MITVTTFGYRHGGPPPAHLTLDLREHSLDSHLRPGLRNRTAHDIEVRDATWEIPGNAALIKAIVAAVKALASAPGKPSFNLAVGCAEGLRHAPAFAMEIASAMGDDYSIIINHRDLDESASKADEDN